VKSTECGAREQEAKQRRVMAEEERRRKIEGKHMADAAKIEAKAQMLAAEQARLAKEAAEWKARVERQAAEDKAFIDALDHKIKDGDVKAKEKKEAERKMTMLEHARAEGAWLFFGLL
jgi:molybdopterin converting factor small subunit